MFVVLRAWPYTFLFLFQARGFSIEYLSKIPEVKDTVHKHSLLHHLCAIIIEQFPDTTDLYSEIGALARCSRVSKNQGKCIAVVKVNVIRNFIIAGSF